MSTPYVLGGGITGDQFFENDEGGTGSGGTSGSVADDIPLPSVDPNYDKWPVVPNKTVGTKALYQYVSEVQDYIKLTELGDTVGATFKEYSNFKFPGTSSYGTPTISTLYVPTTTDS